MTRPTKEELLALADKANAEIAHLSLITGGFLDAQERARAILELIHKGAEK